MWSVIVEKVEMNWWTLARDPGDRITWEIPLTSLQLSLAIPTSVRMKSTGNGHGQS